MISAILYGRNDNYGYNLHKRAALSFNCIAEVLDETDEIIFVDYNTPDDFPTFPEAIQDTLTKRARELLRVLRVRPFIHDRFKSKTPLLALEPIARNVAVRRSRPSNRWILSTNTDMIFILQRVGSLVILSETCQRDSITRPGSNFRKRCGKVWTVKDPEKSSTPSAIGDGICTSMRLFLAAMSFAMTVRATSSFSSART